MQLCDARVDKRREMPRVALLEFWEAPVVAGHDSTATGADAMALHTPFGCDAEQCVVERELFASRDVAARAHPALVQHPQIRITGVIGAARSARVWVIGA